MDCPQCHSTNPPAARFCGECGAHLERPCPACGHVPAPHQKFCVACGQSLTVPEPEASWAPEATGERRYATVLFSDLTGYTALNETLDPEEVSAFMAELKRGAVEIVEALGGSVNQFVGDEVLALFGIPTAHQDDPRRAVEAALQMHAAVRQLSDRVESTGGPRLRLHSGIYTGLVVTRTGELRDGKVGITGDTVNTAARLRAEAAEDEILLGEETARLAGDHYASLPLEPMALKGKAQQVTPHRLLGSVEEGAAAGATPFVGRQAELVRVRELLARCLKDGKGGVVVLRGDAGIGKTRLSTEIERLAHEAGYLPHRGTVMDTGPHAGRGAIRTLFNSLLDISDGDPRELRVAAVQRGVTEGLIDAAQEPYLHALLDLPMPEEHRAVYEAMDNEERIRRRRATIATLIRSFCARRPRLLIVDDLHFADSLTLGYLAELAATVEHEPAVLLATTRPDNDPMQQGWPETVSHDTVTVFDLQPFGVEESNAMVSGLIAEVEQGFAGRCVQRAEGNPLFLEHLLRARDESLADSLPGSVQGLVLARMDTLPPEERHALQVAAVLGQNFGVMPLRHLLGNPGYHCDALVRKHLVQAGEPGYFQFTHALVRDGSYQSMLLKRRKELHLQAAEWFANRDPATRARHYELAEHPDTAVAYLEAAEAEAQAQRIERALSFAERGLGHAAQGEQSFALLTLKLRLLVRLGRTEAAESVGRDALSNASTDAQRAQALTDLAGALRLADALLPALEMLDEARELAERQGLRPLLARIHHLSGNIHFPLGHLEQCQESHEQALRLAREEGLQELEVQALLGLGDAMYLPGRMYSAVEHFTRCLELADQHHLLRHRVECLYMLSACWTWIGELERAVPAGEEAGDLARQLGHGRAEAVSENTLSGTLVLMGKTRTARIHLQRCVTAAQEAGAKRFEAEAHMIMAQVLVGEGKREEGLQLMNAALQMAREGSMGYCGASITAALAELTADPEESAALLREGEAVLKEGAVSHSHYNFYRMGIDLSLREQAWEEAERYADALEAYTAVEPLPLMRFIAERGRLLAALGRGEGRDGLAPRLQQALADGQAMGVQPLLPALQAALKGP